MHLEQLAIVRKLLAVYTETVGIFSGRLESLGADSLVVIRYLNAMERVAGQAREANEPEVANLILDSVYFLKADIHASKDDFQSVARYSYLGMTVATFDSASFYLHAGWAAKSHFSLNEIELGYQVLTNAISTATKYGVGRREVPGLLMLARISELGRADALFRIAVCQYAVQDCGHDETDFLSSWQNNPAETIKRLLSVGPAS
jgi:hypothetical protein